MKLVMHKKEKKKKTTLQGKYVIPFAVGKNGIVITADAKLFKSAVFYIR